jgi:hypothetical protein
MLQGKQSKPIIIVSVYVIESTGDFQAQTHSDNYKGPLWAEVLVILIHQYHQVGLQLAGPSQSAEDRPQQLPALLHTHT